MSKLEKAGTGISIHDKLSRRRFIAAGSGLVLAGSAVIASRNTQAADCDRGGEQNARADQDAGEKSDPKGCQSKNIISRQQIPNNDRVIVKKSQA